MASEVKYQMVLFGESINLLDLPADSERTSSATSFPVDSIKEGLAILEKLDNSLFCKEAMNELGTELFIYGAYIFRGTDECLLMKWHIEEDNLQKMPAGVYLKIRSRELLIDEVKNVLPLSSSKLISTGLYHHYLLPNTSTKEELKESFIKNQRNLNLTKLFRLNSNRRISPPNNEKGLLP